MGPLRMQPLPGREGTDHRRSHPLRAVTCASLSPTVCGQVSCRKARDGRDGHSPKAPRSPFLTAPSPGLGAQRQALVALVPLCHCEEHLTRTAGTRCAPLPFQVINAHVRNSEDALIFSAVTDKSPERRNPPPVPARMSGGAFRGQEAKSIPQKRSSRAGTETAGDTKKPVLHLSFCGSLKRRFQSGTYQHYIPIAIQTPVYNLDDWPGTTLLFTMI